MLGSQLKWGEVAACIQRGLKLTIDVVFGATLPLFSVNPTTVPQRILRYGHQQRRTQCVTHGSVHQFVKMTKSYVCHLGEGLSTLRRLPLPRYLAPIVCIKPVVELFPAL